MAEDQYTVNSTAGHVYINCGDMCVCEMNLGALTKASQVALAQRICDLLNGKEAKRG